MQARVFACFLAYALWRIFEPWARGAGTGDLSRTVLDELELLQSVDVVLPTTDGVVMRVHCAVNPEPFQAKILERLGMIGLSRCPRGNEPVLAGALS